MKIQKVCVIGAGLSGLVAAKTFLEEGFDVTVFEKQEGIGGVWEKSRSYPGVTTQTPGKIYSFPDYPMSGQYPEWPSGEEVRNYLESYAHHFNIFACIHFQTEVIALTAIDGGCRGWMVTIRSLLDATSEQKHTFDFVIICNGVQNIPNMPAIPGIDAFITAGGSILHTTQVNSIDKIKDKRVVVVGFGKSATDIAMLAAKHGAECYLVFRQALWKTPRFFFGLVNFKLLFFTRFAEAFSPKRKQSFIERWLHQAGKPLVQGFWRLTEVILGVQFQLKQCRMIPSTSLMQSVNATIGIAPAHFYKYVRLGKIRAYKTSIAQFIPGGVELASGDRLTVDVVVFGTGFRQDIPFLDEKYRHIIIDRQGYFHLYRNLIHPSIPNLAFLGYNVTLSATISGDLGARWLLELVKGNIQTPAYEEMIAEMEADLQWRKHHLKATYQGTCLLGSTFSYLDTLMRDMGASPRQSGSVANIMQPLDPSAYQNLKEELQLKRYSDSLDLPVKESTIL